VNACLFRPSTSGRKSGNHEGLRPENFLATVGDPKRQPVEIMGTAAAIIVLEAISAGLGKTVHNHPPPNRAELIVRESTRSVK